MFVPTNADRIAVLKKELEDAEKRELRWRQIGEQMQMTHLEYWKATAKGRRLDVEQFKHYIKLVEAQ